MIKYDNTINQTIHQTCDTLVLYIFFISFPSLTRLFTTTSLSLVLHRPPTLFFFDQSYFNVSFEQVYGGEDKSGLSSLSPEL